MVVIGEPKIHSFYNTHNQAKGPLLAWFQAAKKAKWKSPQDIKSEYAHASILPNNRVVFNIGGNKFRLNVMIRYQSGIILIEDINTHANYDKKNKKK